MNNNWILDVIDDLRSFADRNGFSAISEKLEEASIVAAGELSRGTRPLEGMNGHEGDSRAVYRPCKAGENA